MSDYPDMDTAYEAGVEDGTNFANLHARLVHGCDHGYAERPAADSLDAALAAVRMPHRQGDLHNYGWNDAVAVCRLALAAALRGEKK